MTPGAGAVVGQTDLTRPSGDPCRLSRDPTDLFERHGAALVALAMVLRNDLPGAEALASDAILDACSGPTHPAQGADRWELARYVFVRSERLTLDDSWEQRPSLHLVALALAMFGGHSRPEVARLLRLSEERVAGLLPPRGDVASVPELR